LRWEKTGQFDIGLEFTALHNRLSGSIDYYRANTSDLIMDRQLPPPPGIRAFSRTSARTRNTGVEVALSTLLVQDWHGMRWNVEFNAAANRNRIVRLSSGLLSDPGNKWFVGYPISVAYDYQFDASGRSRTRFRARHSGTAGALVRSAWSTRTATGRSTRTTGSSSARPTPTGR